jgi:hypothetical protein
MWVKPVYTPAGHREASKHGPERLCLSGCERNDEDDFLAGEKSPSPRGYTPALPVFTRGNKREIIPKLPKIFHTVSGQDIVKNLADFCGGSFGLVELLARSASRRGTERSSGHGSRALFLTIVKTA